MAGALGCNLNLSSIIGLMEALTLRSDEFSSNGSDVRKAKRSFSC